MRNVLQCWRRIIKMGKDSANYDQAFFERQRDGSRASSEIVAQLVLEEFPRTQTIVDVGCGSGAWASAFLAKGRTVLGIDGAYVDLNRLFIPPSMFSAVDLNTPPPARQIGNFDLAICVEVAEHLNPEKEVDFIDFLTTLAPIVLFGAAIPGQGGVGHINEQWQSHWVSLFERFGFGCRDIIRPKVWSDSRVKPWYAQNTFVFIKGAATDGALQTDIVHPETYMRTHKNRRRLWES